MQEGLAETGPSVVLDDGMRERLTGRRLHELARLGALDLLAADEKAGFAFRCRAHELDDTAGATS
jgi:hypothetical protein